MVERSPPPPLWKPPRPSSLLEGPPPPSPLEAKLPLWKPPPFGSLLPSPPLEAPSLPLPLWKPPPPLWKPSSSPFWKHPLSPFEAPLRSPVDFSYTPEPRIALYLNFVQLKFFSCVEHFFVKVSESNPILHMFVHPF